MSLQILRWEKLQVKMMTELIFHDVLKLQTRRYKILKCFQGTLINCRSVMLTDIDELVLLSGLLGETFIPLGSLEQI